MRCCYLILFFVPVPASHQIFFSFIALHMPTIFANSFYLQEKMQTITCLSVTIISTCKCLIFPRCAVVTIDKDKEKAIRYQKGHGEWNPSMASVSNHLH